MFRMSDVPTGVILAVALLVGSAAHTQTTTGRIIGTVMDEGGEALPGVTVTISSPAMIGGAQTKISDGKGDFQFISLHPGDYTVTADLSGFVSQERQEVKVPLGGAASLIIVMPQSSFAEEIQVSAEAPVVDPTQVNTGQVFTENWLQGSAIGSGNRQYQTVLFQAPGVSGGGNVFGSTDAENAYFVDGVDTTDPVTATWGTNFNFDAIQEIQFQTGGFEAQYGRATGGIINLVTKSGGNQISGTADIRFRNSSFQTSGDHFDANEQETSFQDVAFTLGGPILRDRLWFFVSYEYVNSEVTPEGSPTTFDFEGQYPLAKLTWQMSTNWRAIAKYSADPTDIDNANASRFNAADATAFQTQPSSIGNIELNGVLSDALALNIALGSFNSQLDVYPQHQDLSRISHNEVTGFAYNSYPNQQYRESTRNEITTDLTWFVDDLAGSHEFKGGLEYADLEFTSANCNTGTEGGVRCTDGVMGRYFVEFPGAVPFLMWTDLTPGFTTDTGTVSTAFLQDAWRIHRNVTLKAGVRYDNAKYDNEAGQQIADLNKWQPRIGIAWDITGDAKNVFRANYGHYMHPNALTLPNFAKTGTSTSMGWFACSFLGGTSVEDCQAFAASVGGQWSDDPESFDPTGWILFPFNVFGGDPNEIVPDLRATYSEEFIIGYEREVGNRASIEFSYVDKQTTDLFEDTCSENWPTPTDDPILCSSYTMANLPELKRDYEGFVIKFETRTFNWLTLLTSYTYSESKGSLENTQNTGTDFDFYPAHYDNRYGYLNDHRQHRFKLNGFFHIKGDWTFSFDYFYSSAFRWEPQATSANSGGEWEGQTIPYFTYGVWYAEPRGSRKANANTQLDLQVAKGFTIGRTRLVFIGSVINALDWEKGQGVCAFIDGCADAEGNTFELGETTLWQNPMRFELGFRIEF